MGVTVLQAPVGGWGPEPPKKFGHKKIPLVSPPAPPLSWRSDNKLYLQTGVNAVSWAPSHPSGVSSVLTVALCYPLCILTVNLQ